jgi:hypothetical protein
MITHNHVKKVLGLPHFERINWNEAKAKCKALIVVARRAENDSQAAHLSQIKQFIKARTRLKPKCAKCGVSLSVSNENLRRRDTDRFCLMHTPRLASQMAIRSAERTLTA